MSELTKQALKVENNQSFPNNNAGLITPTALRGFNEDMIDSTVNQAVYTADSASFNNRINAITGSGGSVNTGSLLTTASFDNGTRNLTFTKGDSSTFAVNIPDVSGSVLPSGVVSGSSQIILQQTTGNLSGSRIDGLVVSASNALTASEARNVVIIARNGNPSTLPAGTVVHITSAVGDNPIFNTASYDTEALSSNTLGILRNSAPSGADVEVVVNGVVVGVNTNPALGFVAGDIIYLSSGGGFTRVQPQAPNQIVALGQVLRAQVNNGSIYVSINNGWELNELHNVQITNPQTNQLLAYESASYGLWKNKSASSIGLVSTGSNNFIGNQTITGSLSVSDTVKSQVYINPQTIDGFTIPTGNNAMLVGPIAISGSVVVEGNSNLLILSQITGSGGTTTLPSGVVSGSSQLTASYDLRYTLSGSVQPLPSGVVSGSSQLTSSYDLRYALSGSGGGTIPTGSFATTGSNIFIGNQTITGSLYLSSSNEIVFNVPNFPGQPAPGGLSVTGSMAVQGNFAVNGGGFTVGQVNTPKIVGQGGTLQIVSDVLVFNDSGFGAPKNLGVSGSAFISGSVNLRNVLNLEAQNPLPSGNVGDLAVSGSSLYFYNGAWTLVV
jgi:hypothetical protein